MYNSTYSEGERALLNDIKVMDDMDGMRYEDLETEI